MTVAELQSAIADARARGRTDLQLVLPGRQPRGERVQLVPGVRGEIACVTERGCIAWFKLGDLERAIERGRIL